MPDPFGVFYEQKRENDVADTAGYPYGKKEKDAYRDVPSPGKMTASSHEDMKE